MKRALITGITGQDGSYLAELLLSKGYEVYGTTRRISSNLPEYFKEIKSKKNIHILYGDMKDKISLERAVNESCPDEIYNLASQSNVHTSFKYPEETMDINYRGLERLVSVAVKKNPKVRIYQASTSEMFGNTNFPQNENSYFAPVSPYGKAKLKAHRDLVVKSRKESGLFICSGFLFNHESPRRGECFVTRKITMSLAKIKLGVQDSFELGNLEAKKDWGFAKDYVKAMWLMLQQDEPKDFVISTGENHTVRDFVEATALSLNMKLVWKKKGLEEIAKDENGKILLRINKKYYRPIEAGCLLGDSSEAQKILGWSPSVTFKELVKMMSESDLRNFSNTYSPD